MGKKVFSVCAVGLLACSGLMRIDSYAAAPGAGRGANSTAVRELLNAPPQKLADVVATLQTALLSTNEEWSVILPMLRRVELLRDEVHATASAAPARRRGAFDSPLGGTSMDAPTMASGRGVNNPFDPKNATGIKSTGGGLLSALGLQRPLTRAVTNLLTPRNGNSVEHLLSDLQTLLAARETTDQQLREKLASLRAARRKAAHDLAVAEKELAALLTTDQLALLVTLGYLD